MNRERNLSFITVLSATLVEANFPPVFSSMGRDEREREYYNDMPGKVPPDVGPPPVPPLPNLNHNASPEPRGKCQNENGNCTYLY